MSETLILVLSCVASYLFGSLPFGLWVGLIIKGVDIRTLGSHNIGATNVLRVLGVGPGLLVFALDTFKGAAVLTTAKILFSAQNMSIPIWWQIIIVLFAIFGHTYSIFLNFKGGKGVATTLGALLALNPIVAAIGLSLWAIILLLTKYVSLASIIASASLPILPLFLIKSTDKWWLFGIGLAMFILITVKHRSNIQRLKDGTENKLWGNKKKTEESEGFPDAIASEEESV